MTRGSLEDRIAGVCGGRVIGSEPLHGGCVADVRRFELADGRRVVAKVGSGECPRLDIEGMMLDRLAGVAAIPVPRVLHCASDLLVMEAIIHDGVRSAEGEIEAADLLARLHANAAERFGFGGDTLIGPLIQPNRWMERWPGFFAERRLLQMGRKAHEAGSLPPGTLDRLGAVAGDIERLIDPVPSRPGLIHGDIWSGNVLWHGGRVAAFIDPATYFADPEIEYAFIDLFGCFGPAFWSRVEENGSVRPGFFELRKDLYNLYPLLVHAVLFDGGYGARVSACLAALGY